MKTANGGVTWYALATTTTNQISKIAFPTPNQGWIVGQRGMILKTANGGGTGTLITVKQSRPPVAVAVQSYANFPNPVIDHTYIPYDLRVRSYIDVEIYDLLGHPIRHLYSGIKGAGVHNTASTSIYWDARDDAGQKVPSGAYFYSIQTSYGTLYGKLVVIR
jgi:hypothetical protein